jgi:hypothetical protein
VLLDRSGSTWFSDCSDVEADAAELADSLAVGHGSRAVLRCEGYEDVVGKSTKCPWIVLLCSIRRILGKGVMALHVCSTRDGSHSLEAPTTSPAAAPSEP